MHQWDPGRVVAHLPGGQGQSGRAAERLDGFEQCVGVDIADTAALVLSELMSNAIRHARTPTGRQIGVRVAQYDGRLRVEVADANSARPVLSRAETDDEQGRGLAIVSALASRWGCCPRLHGIGKATWAEIPLPAQPRCVAANIRSTAGSTTTEGPGSPNAFARSVSSVSADVRTPGTRNDSASAT